ncbi:hypothetical protein WMY93_020007 [Mugilogobius chulae]|uniref:RNA-binding protein 48 n=1 Tax=Mugilogobius chulae TaxID=88201 RepID=A0AAW0NLQ3_9GOBI
MAAPVSHKQSCWKAPEVFKHHEQRKICISRPKYREGRKAKAVKVYTINLESCYVMVQGVPAIGVMNELIQLCALYGTVEEYRPLDEYPAEEFTEVYLVKFQRLASARAAKRHMDEKSFYGGVLHVCYVPEYETVEDTRLKLQDRMKYIMKTLHYIAKEKRQMEDAAAETTSPNATLAPSEATTSKPSTTVTDNTEDLSSHEYSAFPLIPLPPREYPGCYRTNLPTEDKMGTLHNAIVDKRHSSDNMTSPNTPSDTFRDQQVPLQASVRFLPRTTQLENRKRLAEEGTEQSLKEATSQSEIFIGPKLPEQPKLDMEDESLNTTVKIIRDTLKQVESVAEVKPVVKKVKKRRRI